MTDHVDRVSDADRAPFLTEWCECPRCEWEIPVFSQERVSDADRALIGPDGLKYQRVFRHDGPSPPGVYYDKEGRPRLEITGYSPERITEADRALIARMEAEVLAAQRLQGFVSAHIAATYGLKDGDRVEDGLIVRLAMGETT